VSRLVRAAILALLAAAASPARAEGYLDSPYRLTRFLSLDWEPAAPMESLRDYVDDVALRGGQFDVRFGVARHLSLGIATSWQWFAQNWSARTVQYQNAAVTGTVYSRVQFITLRATLHWYLTDGPLQPFVGFGAGGVWYDTFQAVADVSETTSGFAFAGDPEVGVLWTVGPGLALQVLARYQYTTAKFANVENAQYLVIGIGVAVY
jgi:hypothetical protein